MAGRRKHVLDVREIIRRLKLGQSEREVAVELGTSRKTIVKYRKVAIEEGWLAQADLPSLGEVELKLAARKPNAIAFGPESTVEPHREKVAKLYEAGVEIMAIWGLLKEQNKFEGSYEAVKRFVRRLPAPLPEAFVRVETDPGEEAQVDFGYAGKMLDSKEGRLRKAWVFVMTLSWSRHQYAEVVFDQKVETWIALHIRAFEFFGGQTKRVRPDNLKAAIIRAVTHDQEAQRSYREYAEHADFLISPCVPHAPRLKGKVEQGGVHYVKRNALAGRKFETPDQNVHHANDHLRRWCMETAGVRKHGTTKEQPLARFEAERLALKALPQTRYEIAVWAQAKLHPDCHVVFDNAYYSAPHRLIGKKLLVRATPGRVEIYHEHERLATHVRATRPGERVSNIVHYPPTKLAGLLATPVRLREQATQVGPKTAELIGKMLEDKPVDRLRAAQGILSLSKRHGPARLEAACRRALVFNLASFRTVKAILEKGLEDQPLPPEAVAEGPVPKTAQFARSIREIATGL
jgi:transposase